METGRIIKVTGPLVVAEGMKNVNMFDVVSVSDKNLVGEVIEIRDDKASIQVYEETSGIGTGDKVVTTGEPLCVELAPGLMGKMFDGIQRPLEEMIKKFGSTIKKGITVDNVDKEKKWAFNPVKEIGDKVIAGDILGTVQETVLIEHKVMVPFEVQGELLEIKHGDYNITETIAKVKDNDGTIREIQMLQKWPVRKGRPFSHKKAPTVPLVTGQRIIDSLFPIAKGGVAAVPGPFGSGKTVVQHQLAKWADAEIVVYIGCGERGNEMTDVLVDFPEIIDPKSGESLMNRTILIANTSDMPVAAREASIYTGITIAEYYRDMGYNVALMADSTSRWAEALREMSGRLEEMPGEEGYPAYLSSRVAQFYERAGRVQCLGSEAREGSLTAIGAVSPPGGDLSEPVTQATLRVVKAFWSLDASLAHRRHFPAINWINSYSLYDSILEDWYTENVGTDFYELKKLAVNLLQQESELQEIVRLVGVDALSEKEILVLETAMTLKEDYLQQNAFDAEDTYASSDKQYKLLKLIVNYYHEGLRVVSSNVDFSKFTKLPVREDMAKVKYCSDKDFGAEINRIESQLRSEVDDLLSGGDLND